MAPTTRTLSILDRPEVTGILYHPRPDSMRPAPGSPAQAVHIPVAEGISVGGMIFPAREGGPAILYFHGNGEIASDYLMLADLYTGLGITLFVVDYRGYGASDGSPTASTQLADALEAYGQARRLLAANGAGTENLFVMGRSLGSASALEVAVHARDEISGLIIESGFALTFPLIERLGALRFPEADEGRDGFGNLAKIARVRVPTLIIHGREDWIIPAEDGHMLHERAGAADLRMLEIPGAGHNDLLMVGQRAYFTAIRDFVARVATK